MVFALARAWVATIPEFELAETDETTRSRRRDAVVEAARRLITRSATG